MQNATKALGVDLILRGQRDEEELRVPMQDGARDENGIEICLPIRDWKTSEVYWFLKTHDVELPRFYEMMNCSVDCMHCTAYLKDTRGKVQYLRRYHPEAAAEVERRLGVIGKELVPDIEQMKQTLMEIGT